MNNIITSIVNELDSSLLNQTEQDRLGNLFYALYTDLSGNDTFSQIWNNYINNYRSN
jgi:hypothetical protein